MSALTSSDKPWEQENTMKAEQALRDSRFNLRDASQESLTLVSNAETKNNTKSLVFILFHSKRKMKEVMVNR